MENKMDDGGKLVLRVVLAVLILFHGVSKLIGGVGFISGMLVKAGLPGALGYLVYVGEVIAPLLVLFGVFTRAAALIVAVNMIVALVLFGSIWIMHHLNHNMVPTEQMEQMRRMRGM